MAEAGEFGPGGEYADGPNAEDASREIVYVDEQERVIAVESEPASREIAVIGTGEVVDLDDERSCLLALAALRDFDTKIKETKAVLSAAIIDRARRLGVKTLVLPDGRKATISAGSDLVWIEVEEMEEELREAGMPEERIREIIVQQITHEVKTQEAKRAAAANESYAAIIARHETRIPKKAYVSSPK